ncbi:MAG TPA: chemotaxis protein CheB [Steroidobacteraceae bacterium]|jgi:two-component system chemotaxis response regulator CheB
MAKRRPVRVTRDIVVIGTSAGGVQVLQELLRGLPDDFPGSIFIVAHLSPTRPSILPQILDRATDLPVEAAQNGGRIRRGRVYVCVPDYHLTLKRDHMVLSRRGPRENGFRPAVDPLFRTAARAFGSRTVGLILTGGMDDGTLGLGIIKDFGGIAIAQDPEDAVFPNMPQSAIRHVNVDYVMPVASIPALLTRLASEPLPAAARAMANPRKDAQPDVAETGRAALLAGLDRGPPTNVTCPQCGGSLWELNDRKLARYECHVGHSYTAETLLEDKNGELEGALWGGLRALEEGAELRRRMARRLRGAPRSLWDMRGTYERDAQDAESRASVLRSLLGNGTEVKRLAGRTSAESRALAAQGDERRTTAASRQRHRRSKIQ